jgi:GntR family transcriptional regulator, transcriptional repressor for pyruvate dehydrogenase complex
MSGELARNQVRAAVTRASTDRFSPIETESAVEAVVNQIIDRIRAGELSDGTVLPGERQLAVGMNVSRRTIRGAIEVLQDAGVVQVSPGPAGGTRVASVWIPDSLERYRRPSTAGEVFQVLEARRVIELRVAQLAALRATDEDFAIMGRTIELQSENRHDLLRVNQGNVTFHRQLWRAAHNPELEAAMRSIYRRLPGVFFAALEQEATEATAVGIELHHETLEAIRSGRADLTEKAMDRHLAYLERRCEAFYGRARIPQLPDFLRTTSQDDRGSRPTHDQMRRLS